MVLPIISVFLALIFLGCTIFLTRQAGLPALKSSLLAVLQALDADTKKDLGGVRAPSEMAQVAKGLKVGLENLRTEWAVGKVR